jgi:hypothetical protein
VFFLSSQGIHRVPPYHNRTVQAGLVRRLASLAMAVRNQVRQIHVPDPLTQRVERHTLEKEAAMIRPSRRFSVISAAFILAACTKDSPTDALESRSAIVLSHSPAHWNGAAAVVAVAAPSYTTLDDASALDKGNGLLLTVDASGDIPRFPDAYIESVAVFGYAWVDANTGRGIVAVIHPLIGRDSRQNPDGWHTHPVQLAAGAAFNFCIVSIGGSQAGISIQGDELSVRVNENSFNLSAADLDVAAAFIVRPDAGCTGTGLGVEVLSTATP